MDAEYKAVEAIIAALDPLDSRARMRAIAVAMDRLALAEISIAIEAKSKTGKARGVQSFD